MPQQCPAYPLPHLLPDDPDIRAQLIAFRLMAAHGLYHCRPSWLMFHHFRLDARRRLVLLRTFVVELARSSQRRIKLAPPCALRMTEDELQLVCMLSSARIAPDQAAGAARLLTAEIEVERCVSVAAMLARPASACGGWNAAC